MDIKFGENANQIYSNPGVSISIIFETLDGYQDRTDGYGIPVIDYIINPAITLLSGYPTPMNRIDVGLYSFVFTPPNNPSSVGSFIIDILFIDPILNIPKRTFYQVIVSSLINLTGGYSISVI